MWSKIIYNNSKLNALLIILIFSIQFTAAENKTRIKSTLLLLVDSISQREFVNLKKSKKIIFIPEFQNLHSTHTTNFNGGSLIIDYQYSKTLYFGIGAEFSLAKFHGDNGWNLTNLKFFPLFIDFKLKLTRNSVLVPFFHSSEGISFNSYNKEDANSIGKPYNVAERGFYVYTGFGIIFRLSKYFEPIFDLGFKGYHMSFNNLDVNPHGLTMRLGLIF
jgi:hypothetical protein